MKNIQNRCDLSDNAVLNIASSLRTDGVEIESGLRSDLFETGTLLEEFFEIKHLDMEIKVDNEVEIQSKAVVLCKNIPDFVEFIREKRGLKNPFILKYGADGGGKEIFEPEKIAILLIVFS